MAEIEQQFAAAVRAARKQRKLSQMALAEAIGASVDAVSAIEREINAPSLATAAALIRVLGIDSNELFGGPTRRETVRPARLTQEAELQGLAQKLDDRGVTLLLELAEAVAKVHSASRPRSTK
jgi:transcriptional regulator with XRE-family HTH domain